MERGAYLRLKFGDARGSGAYDRISEAGSGEGIEFNFPGIKRTPNTLGSHRLVRYAGELDLQHQVVEALFQAYFVEGRDIGDAMTLLDIGSAAGLERGPLADYMERQGGHRGGRARGRDGAPDGRRRRPLLHLRAQIRDLRARKPPSIFLQVFEMIEREQSGAAAEQSS